MKKKEYFLNMPTEFLNPDFLNRNGLTRKLYVTHLMIDRWRTVDGYSKISLRELLNYVGSQETRKSSTICQDFLHCLTYMVENNMIEVMGDSNLNEIYHYDSITLKIIDRKFYGDGTFVGITTEQFELIPKISGNKKPENVLSVLLFMLSRMWRKGSKATYNARPEAYYFGVNLIHKAINMSKRVAEECIDILTSATEEYPSILIKYTRTASRSYRNIYVINKEGYEEEIKNALDAMNRYNPMGEFEVPDFW